jgi:hypothetical protein
MNISRASLTVGLLIGTSLALVEVSLAAEPVPQPTVPGISAIDLTAPRTLKEAGFLTENPPPTIISPITFSPRIGGQFTTGPGVGYSSSFGTIEGFIPLTQTPGWDLSFLQGKLLLSVDRGQVGGNLILGYRAYDSDSNSVLGGYLAYDIRNTGNATFSQLGLGLENIGEDLEIRANGYIPLGNSRRQISESITDITSFSSVTSTSQAFQGNYLVIGSLNQQRQINRTVESALAGFDAEAGVKIAQWSPTGTLRVYGGTYYYNALGTAGFMGVRGRLEARLDENFRLGLSVQGDREFGTTAIVSFGITFSDTSHPEDTLLARMGESVTRQDNIAITKQVLTDVVNTSSSTIFATNPATNQPWLFQHVKLGNPGGNGTFENPFGTVQNALNSTLSDGNDIVYVQAGTNPGIPAFTIPNRVQVLSTGPVQQISTVQIASLQLPLSGRGTLPNVTNTVTMGNNTVLSGFNITGATGAGIAGNGINTVEIRDNTITNSTNSGVLLQNLTGTITLKNNNINSATNQGIFLQSVNGTVNITNNAIANTIGVNLATPTGQGMALSEITGKVNIIGNTISGTNGFFAAVPSGQGMAFSNNTGAVDLTISGNQIRNNYNDGILIGLGTQSPGNATANIIISGNTIENNGGAAPTRGDGIAIGIENTVTANLTISGNTIQSNGDEGIDIRTGTISASSATLKATITNNNILNNTQNGIELASNIVVPGTSRIDASIQMNTFNGNLINNFNALSYSNSTICLRSLNNTIPTNFIFTRNGTSTFQYEPLTGNTNGNNFTPTGTITSVGANTCLVP